MLISYVYVYVHFYIHIVQVYVLRWQLKVQLGNRFYILDDDAACPRLHVASTWALPCTILLIE